MQLQRNALLAPLTLLPLLLALACGGTTTQPQEASAVEPPPGEANLPPIPAGDLRAAIEGVHRPETERARDVHRHPKETLEFFSVDPTMTVVEVWPGGGWYTRVLAPYLQEGRLILATRDPETTHYAADFNARRARAPRFYEGVETAILDGDRTLDELADESVDRVLTFRSIHTFVQRGVAQEYFDAFARVLKIGGVLGVVQHRAEPGHPTGRTGEEGYVEEALIVELAQAAGFELELRSEINANPRDTHHHPGGVWWLPPSLRGDEATPHAERIAIGESDRMTLRFVRTRNMPTPAELPPAAAAEDAAAEAPNETSEEAPAEASMLRESPETTQQLQGVLGSDPDDTRTMEEILQDANVRH